MKETPPLPSWLAAASVASQQARWEGEESGALLGFAPCRVAWAAGGMDFIVCHRGEDQMLNLNTLVLVQFLF